MGWKEERLKACGWVEWGAGKENGRYKGGVVSVSCEDFTPLADALVENFCSDLIGNE